MKYSKAIALLVSLIFGYLIFTYRHYAPLHDFLLSTGYLGTFLTGIFYVFSFTAIPATAILLTLADSQNIFALGVIAGMGALVGDSLIFNVIKVGLHDEVHAILHIPLVQNIKTLVPKYLKRYVEIILACGIIASPMPDELGIAMISDFKLISTKHFMIFSYFLNTVGIFIILFIGEKA